MSYSKGLSIRGRNREREGATACWYLFFLVRLLLYTDTDNAIGLLESYHIARQDLKLDSNVVVAGRFVKNNNAPTRLTREEVYPALVHALKRHAALSVRAVRASGGKKGHVFERLETVNLEKVVLFLDASTDAEDVAALIQDGFTRPIASDCGPDVPLWRLTITSNNLVLFAWHHCIADGQSGLAFFRTFLEGLNTTTGSDVQTDDLDPSVVKTPTDLNLTPPIETLTDVSLSVCTLVGVIVGLLVPPSISLRRVWTGNPVLPPSTPNSFRTRTRLVSISADHARRISTAAREHKTTLTAVLYILGVNVLSQLIISQDTQRNSEYIRLVICIPASLRPLANVAPTVMGEFASSFSFSECLPSTPSPNTTASDFEWNRAAALSQKLRTSLPTIRQVIGSLKYLYGRYDDYYKGKLGKKRERSFEFSNLGAFKLSSSTPSPSDSNAHSYSNRTNVWTITESYFSQDVGIIGAALKMNSVGSPSGSINITVTWGEGAVDDGFAEAFVRDLGLATDNFTSQLSSKEEKATSS